MSTTLRTALGRLALAVIYFAAFLALFIFVPKFQAKAMEVPALKGRVSDYASVLTDSQVRDLTNKLRASSKGDQTAVLIIKTLDGASIEEFASDVFSKWKLGDKEKNDGLLLIIVTQDRKLRIHTGYGMEAKIVDYQASLIIDKMKPALKAGDWAKGIAIFIDETKELKKKE